NDVLVGGRKIAGILLESRIAATTVVAIGIGINLGQRRFPDGLDATSVLLESSRAIDADSMLDALLSSFDAHRQRLETEGFASIRRRWLALTDMIDRPVAIEGERGVAVDLDVDGALVVRGDGGLRHIVAGELTRSSGAD